ncbi:MAG: hypothetical protein EZS26_000313 [Candidatus Ordinivivax streblomastigis]|uniref:Uncharacterized protein n=1 Tax=Candidatus Ordinivivax streblomastigis TaxID=2540710 RepID=A0A5M8P631_9BACT|nr:MAG: hypothetical protein EZS26_000313 [Candidatus Ordinivivax streblomastigis]
MKKIYLLFLTLSLSLGYASADTTRYVDGSVAESGDGLTWETALQTITEAYTAAASGDEIWVAAGDYTTTSITLKSGVQIYGGFAGTETAINQRAKVPAGKAWEFANVTKVTNETGVVFTSSAALTASTTIIDGLTIEGNTTGTGEPAANTYAVLSSGTTGGITVRNSIIQNTNKLSAPTTRDHGGLQFKGTDCVAEYCLIQGNKGKNGGGAYVERGTLRNSEIKNNWTRADGASSAGNAANAGNGGGVFLITGGKVYNCLISGNTSSYGGGAFLGNSANDLFYNNIVVNNTAKNGSAISFDSRNATGGFIYNVTIANNTATETGGAGVYFLKGNRIYNSILYNNTDGAGAVVNVALDAAATTPILNYSIVDDITTLTKVNYDGSIVETEGINIFDVLTYIPAAGNAGIDKGLGTIEGITLPDEDFAGADRVSGQSIDIGAYELQPAPAPVPSLSVIGTITDFTSGTPQIITVSGTDLTGDIQYEVTGDDETAFVVTEVAGWTAAVGGELSITFTSEHVGEHTASLVITSEGAESKIIALKGTGTPTGLVSADAASVKVYIANAILYVEPATAQNVKIFSISGALIYNKTIEGKTPIELQKGDYVVKTATATIKVVL